MVADFSALDAELDQLGAGPAVDAAALASSYVGEVDRLSDIDAALSALAVDVRVDAAVALAQPYVANVPSSLPPPPSSPPPPLQANERLDSDEIALPNAMPRVGNDESGELPLDGVAPQSGSFALPYEDALPSADVAFAEDLTFEADVDELIEMPPPAEKAPSLFARENRVSETDLVAEADFAALFPEVAIEPGPEVSYDDTEIFDTSALDLDTDKPKPLEPIENAFTEELDSAEFEIVMESTESGTQATPASSVPPPSQPPEKRPSFLGRLFGRKEE